MVKLLEQVEYDMRLETFDLVPQGAPHQHARRLQPVRIDEDTYFTPERALNPDWSPDSKWIAYTKILANHLRAVFLYSLEENKAHQVSDGMSDAQFAKFDKILVIRQNKSKISINYKKIQEGTDLEQNILIKPGDTIIVP